MMVAEAVTDPVSTLVGTGLNVGAFGLVIWLVKHTFSHTIPRLAKEFALSLDKQRTEFINALERQETRQTNERQECMAKLESLRKEVVILAEAVKNDMVRVDHSDARRR